MPRQLSPPLLSPNTNRRVVTIMKSLIIRQGDARVSPFFKIHNRAQDSPAAFVGEAISKASHVIANGHPFRTTDDANIFDG